MIDAQSKWVEIFAVPDETADTAANTSSLFLSLSLFECIIPLDHSYITQRIGNYYQIVFFQF